MGLGVGVKVGKGVGVMVAVGVVVAVGRKVGVKVAVGDDVKVGVAAGVARGRLQAERTSVANKKKVSRRLDWKCMVYYPSGRYPWWTTLGRL
jgi:hypothetical protein